MNIIKSLFKGKGSLDDGATLGNCHRGVVSKNKRFASIPHVAVKAEQTGAIKAYNKMLHFFNSGERSMMHLFHADTDPKGEIFCAYDINITTVVFIGNHLMRLIMMKEKMFLLAHPHG
eukprot:308666_1